MNMQQSTVQALRPVASPLAVLVACGWLDDATAADGALRVDDASSSHSVHRVTTRDGRAVIVKQLPPEARRAGRTLGPEMFVYRLAAWKPEVAAIVSRAVYIDERRQVLVIEALSQGAHPRADASGMAPIAPDSGAALGRALGRWHGATAGLAAWASPAPGILGLPENLDYASAIRPPSTRQLMAEIVGDPVLARALNDARERYAHPCLIHGDMRSENWIFDDSTFPPSVKLLDWEFAGTGDPAWDVASVVAEAVLDEVRAQRFRRDGDGPLPRAIIAPMQAFLRDYAAACDGFASAGDWCERVALCVTARLLHVACEVADQAANPAEAPIPQVVAHARAIACERVTVAHMLRQWTFE
jgi:Ser/Thr protein kinase RdoA (MazF antagonist)